MKKIVLLFALASLTNSRRFEQIGVTFLPGREDSLLQTSTKSSNDDHLHFHYFVDADENKDLSRYPIQGLAQLQREMTPILSAHTNYRMEDDSLNMGDTEPK